MQVVVAWIRRLRRDPGIMKSLSHQPPRLALRLAGYRSCYAMQVVVARIRRLRRDPGIMKSLSHQPPRLRVPNRLRAGSPIYAPDQNG